MKSRTSRWRARAEAKADRNNPHPQVKRQLDRLTLDPDFVKNYSKTDHGYCKVLKKEHGYVEVYGFESSVLDFMNYVELKCSGCGKRKIV